MMPLLDENTDVVKLVPLPDRPLRRYEIPLYRTPNGALVLHRIIRVKREAYVICGDNRDAYEYVPREWLVALAVGRYRGGEYLSFDDELCLKNVRRRLKRRDSFFGRMLGMLLRVFPPYSAMKKSYGVLTRAPLLLPLCYAHRLFRTVVVRASAVQKQK